MSPVARVTDPHVCPVADPKSHVGGPLLGPGALTVLIDNLPTAVEGDVCTCVGTPATVKTGSTTVKAADKSARPDGRPDLARGDHRHRLARHLRWVERYIEGRADQSASWGMVSVTSTRSQQRAPRK